MPRTQGSLEYIIIIGGIIILAAASYFMLRGFSTTTAGETSETIGTVGNKYRMELENLGRAKVRFFAKEWLNSSYHYKSWLRLTGPCTDSLTFNQTNLSSYGVNTSELVFTCRLGTFRIMDTQVVGDQIQVDMTKNNKIIRESVVRMMRLISISSLIIHLHYLICVQ
jgi:hypothetical protein